MYSLCILTFMAAMFSLLFTPLVRDWSLRVGLVDKPGNARKIHVKSTPRTGGIPILASYLCAFAVLLLLPMSATKLISKQLLVILPILPSVGLIFLTGLLDDWLSLKPWQKILGQLAAAILAYWSGVHILTVSGHALSTSGSFFITIPWLILCANAFNLIDGLDGLATGVGLTATLTSMIAGLLHGDIMLGLATAPLVGSLLGFLRYNFNPASIFLGDSGSMMIGFMLGIFGVIWGQKSATMLGVAGPLIAFSLPLLEVCLSVVRRFLGNQPLFVGDRGHIHHRLLDLGHTPSRAALLLYGFCGVASALSLLQTVAHHKFSGVAILLFVIVTIVCVRNLRYLELEVIPGFLWKALRPIMGVRIRMALLEKDLLSAKSIEECWAKLYLAAQSLGYSHMRARLGGVQFAETSAPDRQSTIWQMRLCLPGKDYLNITQSRGEIQESIVLFPFIEVVTRVVPQTLERLRAEMECQQALRSVGPSVMYIEPSTVEYSPYVIEKVIDREPVSI